MDTPRWTRRAWGLLLALTLATLCACPNGTVKDGPKDTGQAKAGGEARLPLCIAPGDPALISLDFSDPRLFALARATSLPLVLASEDGTILPGLASEWENSADGITWAFAMNEAGEADLATLYATEIKRLVRRGGAIAAQISDLVLGAAEYAVGRSEDISGLQAEPGKLRLTLTRPNFLTALWLSQPGLALAPDMHSDAPRPHGFGPFLIAALVDGQVTLKPNPASLANQPKLEVLTFIAEPDRTRQVEMFKQGQLDCANIPIGEIPLVEAAPDLSGSVVKHKTAAVLQVRFDHGQFPWGDEQFKIKTGLRAGLNQVLDREQLAAMLNDQIAPWPHVLPETLKDFLDPSLLAQPVFGIGADVEAARTSIKDAGHEQGILLPRGMDMVFLEGCDLDEPARNILEFWNEISAKLRPFPASSAEIQQRVELGTHELMLEAYCPPYPGPDSYYFARLYGDVSNAPGQFCRLRNTELDEVLARAEGEKDELARKKLFQQASRIVEDKALLVFVGDMTPCFLIAGSLAGYKLGAYDFDASLPAQNFANLGRK